MDLETAQTTTTAKLPILQPGLVTTEEKYKDAKTLFATIQTRFGGNEATKKTHKTLIKQMYENFSAPSTESLDSIFNRLQKIVSQLAILGENISQEDLNLRSLPSEWNTHVVVWRNKPNLDTMSFDDLYNNFKIVEQEVKRTASSSSSSSSHNMAFVSSLSNTNEVNIDYGVSTANTQVSHASTQVSTASTQVSTANLSDATVYAFLASQPNGSQLVYEDLEQIHEDDLQKIDLKWQLALMSMRTRRGPRNQDSRNMNQDSSRRTVNVEETSSKAMTLRIIFTPNLDLSYSSLEEFQQPQFEGYGPKSIFVSPKQQEKPVRKPTKYAKMYRSQSPRGNQRNWNNQKSQQLGSDFVMYNKAFFVYRSFNHVQADCNYHQRERVVSGNNYTRVNYNYSAKQAHPSAHRNIVPRAVLMKTYKRSLNTVRPGHPQKEDQGYVDSGCSRHMTGNMSYLSDFKEFDGGYVTFRGGAKGGKITSKETLKTGKLDFEDVYFVKELQFNLFSVSQMCDKKNSVLFTDTGCFVLSLDFKLGDESQVLLKVLRKNNMYSVDMKNIVPKESLTCLVAKATLNESMLWHRRLGHVNLKLLINLLKKIL
ncbi:ribonuclease H-like domain-containing protein [Tanacetum coccineum]